MRLRTAHRTFAGPGGASGGGSSIPVIPTGDLILRLLSENALIDGTGFHWPDTSGQNNHFAEPNPAYPTIAPSVFGTLPGVSVVGAAPYTRCVSPIWYLANAPRTFAVAIRGDGNTTIAPLLKTHRVGADISYQIFGATPSVYYRFAGPDLSLSVALNLANVKSVLMWWTDGGIGDPLFFSVNGTEYAVTGTIPDEGTGNPTKLTLGSDEIALTAQCHFGAVLAWSRVLTSDQRTAVVSNLVQTYVV